MQKQTRSGFTLVELIIVVTITLFLLVATVQGFANSASQFSFSNADETIQSMIQQARSLAISGKAQIDYTDFDKDGCRDKNSMLDTNQCADKSVDDLATPAHYGVNFQKSGSTYIVTLFADNHEVSGQQPKENVFDYEPNAGVTAYENGWDIVLDRYTLPPGMQLIIPQPDGTTVPACSAANCSATIFFSPVFADISSDLTNLPPTTTEPSDPFFRFGIAQNNPNINNRKRCSEIHFLAGISEPMSNLNLAQLNSCP